MSVSQSFKKQSFLFLILASCLFSAYFALAETFTSPLFSYPVSLVLNDETQEVFVANQRSGNIVVVDGFNDSISEVISSNIKWLYRIAVNSKTGEIYAISLKEDKVTVFAPSPQEGEGKVEVSSLIEMPAGSISRQIIVNEATDKIYVANEGSKSISVIDGRSKQVTSTIKLSGAPVDMALNRQKNEIYVIENVNSQVFIIDGKQDEIVGSIKVGFGPAKIIYDEFGAKIFVANRRANSVSIIDERERKVEKEIKVDTSPVDLIFNKETKKLYVANAESRSITIYNLVDEQAVNLKLDANLFPKRFALDSARNNIFVRADGGNKILVIDGRTDQVINTFDIGGQVHEIIVNPRSGKLYGISPEGDDVFVIDPENYKLKTIGAETEQVRLSQNKIIDGPSVLLATGERNHNLFVGNVLSQSLVVFDGDFNLKKEIPVKFTYPGARIGVFRDQIIFAGDDKVLVLPYLSKRLEVKEIDIKGTTVDMAIVDSAKKLFVIAKEKVLNVIDLETDSVARGLPLDFKPSAIKASPDGKNIYVISFDDNRLVVFDALTNIPVKNISIARPAGLRVDSEGENLYISSFSGKKVFRLDAKEYNITKEWQLESAPRGGLLLDERANKLFILHSSGGGISVINLSTDEVRRIEIGERLYSFFVNSKIPGFLYTIDKDGDNVWIYNTENEQLLANLKFKTGSAPVAVATIWDKTYVANFRGNFISVFDKDLKVEAVIRSDGSVIWMQDKGPISEGKNIFEIIGTILVGIMLMVLIFILWRRRKNRIRPAL